VELKLSSALIQPLVFPLGVSYLLLNRCLSRAPAPHSFASGAPLVFFPTTSGRPYDLYLLEAMLFSDSQSPTLLYEQIDCPMRTKRRLTAQRNKTIR
jgi:hypothetical protein